MSAPDPKRTWYKDQTIGLLSSFWCESAGRRPPDEIGEDEAVLQRKNKRKRLGCLLASLVIGLWIQSFATISIAKAQDARANTHPPPIVNAFEGVRFIGPFGAEDEKNPKQDTFTFKDGKFATASCLEWGFTPAPYWVRPGPKGLQFLAELKSPEHGTMRYEGVLDGKKLTVVGYWKKERWYWTVERTYRGHGRPSNAAN
jgi:hypothetical protein